MRCRVPSNGVISFKARLKQRVNTHTHTPPHPRKGRRVVKNKISLKQKVIQTLPKLVLKHV